MNFAQQTKRIKTLASLIKTVGLPKIFEAAKEGVKSLNQPNSTKLGPGHFVKNSALEKSRPFPSIKAAVIMDEFSYSAWNSEFECFAISNDNWRTELEKNTFDFLFVESAWNGNNGQWQYQLTGKSSPSDSLVELVSNFRARDIPTVFWNKEDPPHFRDFLDTARLFDIVFTTDSEMISNYRQELGHGRVYVMSFAAQPAIHNPIGRITDSCESFDVAFAGTYFNHKFPERRHQMDLLLSASNQVSKYLKGGFHIYSRFGNLDEKYRFPEKFRKYIVGELPYNQMVSAYRCFKLFLNVNTVTKSPTMCSRRVFEVLACGAAVLTTPSLALAKIFTDEEIGTTSEIEDAKAKIRALVKSKELRDRMVHRGQRKIWQRHTYTDRAYELLSRVGVSTTPDDVRNETVSIICSTRRPEQIPHLIKQVSQQQNISYELYLGTHGFTIDNGLLEEAQEKTGGHAHVFSLAKELSLGQCLNELVQRSTGRIIAKFDDDDIYCPYYLRDQVNALFYSGADLVGKQAVFVYLEAQKMLLLRAPEREFRWTDFLAGPTFVGLRKIFESVPFASISNGEDTNFLKRVSKEGFSIYSADRFNFVQVRKSDGHTWVTDELTFLANGEVKGFASNESAVTTMIEC